MDKQKKVILGAVVIGICVALGCYFLYAQPTKHQQNEKMNSGTIEHSGAGVIDLHQSMKAHPKYQQLLQLRKERNTLAAAQEKPVNLAMDLQEPQLDSRVEDNNATVERNQKAAAKLKELNERLQKQQRMILQENAPEYEAQMKAIEDQYLPEIFNLQLKINTLVLTKEVAEDIQRQIAAKKQEQSLQMAQVDQKLQQKVAAAMENERMQAHEEMNQYMAELDRNLQMQAQKKLDDAQARNHLAALQKKNELQVGMQSVADSRESLQNKEKEISLLEENILQEISAATAKIAIQEKIAVVFTGVQVNVNARDITEEVIAAFKK